MSLVVTDSEPRMKDLSPEYAEIMVLGKVLQASGYFSDIKDQAQAVTKILYGRELGISPINSMSGIHIIKGKPALSSNLLAALIKRSGKYDYRVRQTTDLLCAIMFLQKVGNVWEEVGLSEFSLEDARRARVVTDDGSWKKWPKAMLFARALSQGQRMFCPEVSMCPLHVPEELGAGVDESGDVVSVPSKSSDVARSTEPIPISGPITQMAADSGEVKGQAKPPKVAEAHGVPVGQHEAPHQREPGSDDGEECIDLPRQRALHRAFKDAIRNPEAQKKADVWLQDWLKAQGYIGQDGRGSTKMIPVVLFDEVKNAAVRFALELPR